MRTRNVSRLISAAVLSAAGLVLVSGPTALGQYQIDNGRTLDSNNRIGSYGNNSGPVGAFSAGSNQIVTGNQVINGNVTGGREFRGFVPYTDPTAFRGATAGRGMDNFVKNSTGAPAPYTESKNFSAQQPQAFYGASRGVAPPAGFVQQNSTGGYVPEAIKTPNLADTRLGNPDALNPLAPKIGMTLQPGLLDTSAQQNPLLNGGAVGNINQMQPTNNFASSLAGPGAGGYGGTGNNSLSAGLGNGVNNGGANSSSASLSQSPLQRPTLGPDGTPINAANSALSNNAMSQGPLGPVDASPQLAPGQLAAPKIGQDQLSSKPLAAKPMDSTLQSKPLTASVPAGGGEILRQQVAGANANALANASPQLAEMQQRLAKFNQAHEQPAKVAVTDQQANQQFQQQMRSRNGNAAAGAAQGGLPPVALAAGNGNGNPPAGAREAMGGTDIGQKAQRVLEGTGTGIGGDNADTERKRAQLDARAYTPSMPSMHIEPLDVSSLATGLPRGELSQGLTDAEKLMRDGKFQSALNQYEALGRKYPANALVALGRANAELGASYYAQAERDLRESFQAEPALLHGRFNLKQLMGADRVNFLIGDLKEIASSEPNEPRPVFLLAYISYHNGNPALASAYLDLAEKRTAGGKPDPVYKLLREHWELPKTTVAPAKQSANAVPGTPPAPSR